MGEPNWREIALWLAYCHAVTAEYDGSLKSVSQNRKNRLYRICGTAARMIRGETVVLDRQAPDVERVLERLDQNSEHRTDA